MTDERADDRTRDGAGQGAVRRRLRVHGMVQGVGYRYSCQYEAERRGLAGWAANLPDGTVEVVVEGPADAVESLIAWTRRGPRHAEVTHVDVAPEEPEGTLRRFSAR